MTNRHRIALIFGVAIAASFAAPVAAHAECLEIGWKDSSNNWNYYKAYVDGEAGGRFQLHYDYKRGRLDLSVKDKEKPSGHVTVFRGRWFEDGKDGRSGKVRLELEDGHHRAKGWYTYGDDENSTHYDLALRECK